MEIRIGASVVRLDNDCRDCPTEEMALRYAQCDAVIARILSDPNAASALAREAEDLRD